MGHPRDCEKQIPFGNDRKKDRSGIHGFFIPGMRLKQNAVPGMVLHLHFTPVTLGTYPIVRSPYAAWGTATCKARLQAVS